MQKDDLLSRGFIGMQHSGLSQQFSNQKCSDVSNIGHRKRGDVPKLGILPSKTLAGKLPAIFPDFNEVTEKCLE
jgi:hypothetical protein